jgi:hypothetical protein
MRGNVSLPVWRKIHPGKTRTALRDVFLGVFYELFQKQFLLIFYPFRYQTDKKIKIFQALFKDAKDNLIVGLFVTMYEHVPEGRHVLKCGQMLFRDDAVFMKNMENVPITLRFAPTVKRYEMIADVDDLFDT